MNDLKNGANTPERLIDGSELMEWLKSKIRECIFLNAHAESATTEEIIRYVKHMPAVDAAPMVHARPVWINPLNPGAKMCTWKCSSLCSACGDYVATGWKYCQNCGAKMDGERRDSE